MNRTLLTVVAILLGCCFGCRDEQAGPKNRKMPVGHVNVVSQLPSALTHSSHETFAQGSIEYLGSQLEPPIALPGKQIQVTHYFRARRPPPSGFGFFVHLVDAQGNLVLNLDHEFQGGNARMESWPVGAIVPDRHVFEVPSGEGALQLRFGFWQGDARLPVDNSLAHHGDNRMLGPWLLPEYKVQRALVAPKIDGVLDDPAWKVALPVELKGSFDGRTPEAKTTAWLTYDDDMLYVSFECEDRDVWGTLKNQDDPIYNEEVVEIFIDADGDGKTYNELQVSPHNVNFDASFLARRSDLDAAKKWVSGMKSAVKVRGTLNNNSDRDDRWFVEMAIPMKNLNEVPSLPPKVGDIWRFNLYRLEHHQRQRIEGQAFSPLFVGDFHHLPRFGLLVFQ